MKPATTPADPKQEMELMKFLFAPEISENPYNFVMTVFPWGQKGTPLEHRSGPRRWQKDALLEMAEHIKANQGRLDVGLLPEVYRSATASGRGPGKSTLCAWLTLWMMTCHIGSTTIVTANTEPQLKTKTWAELGKWHTLAINTHWFERSALSLKPAEWFRVLVEKQLKIDTGYYYASAQLWSEENPDAFAGAHNSYGMLVVFDEASGIPSPIWTVTEGFFTEPVLHRYWLAFSNPRRNTGAFFDCFHEHRAHWHTRHIDARTIEESDIGVLQGIIDKYGDDSDEARIEVKGEFPAQGDKQFISRELIDGAKLRELVQDEWAPLMMGVDVARFGNDSSVARFRRGRDARTLSARRWKGMDNHALALEIAALIDKHQPDAVCIDAGSGAGVIDILRSMRYKVHEAWFGSKSSKPEYGNFGTYLWAEVRDWLRGGCIDNDRRLCDDLANREYRFQGTSDVQRLESKEELKARHLPSPDDGDALACTFAVKVPRLDSKQYNGRGAQVKVADGVDYPIFGG